MNAREHTVHAWSSTASLDCPHRSAWARLGFGSCAEAQAEMERLKVENRDLRRVFKQATAAFREKEAEIQRLKEEAEVLRRKLRDQLQQPFTKDTEQQETAANQEQESPDQPEQKRKKRGAPKGHRGATRKKPEGKPDHTVFVHPEQCPQCHSHNISPCRDTEEHTQEDIVIVRPVLTRFIKQRGYCRDCGELFFPVGKGERPKGYIGSVAVAVAGYLRYVIKMPFDGVRKILSGLWGLDITPAALVGFDKKLATAGRPCYAQIADMVRFSTGINVDETGWPVGALMEWLWTFTNSDYVFFQIALSRAGSVPAGVLGEHYGGVLGSDCFSAYNTLEALAKQKCLTHYERAAKELEKFFPEQPDTTLFAVSLRDIFRRARQTRRNWLEGIIGDEQAERMAKDFKEELDQLVELPIAANCDAENLRKRLITHQNENFTFLRYKGVDPDNNRAERALRPSVVMRKITYGTTRNPVRATTKP